MIKASRRTRSRRNVGREAGRLRGGSAGKPLGGKSKGRFVGAVLVLCAVVAAAVAVEHLSNVGKIQRGVSVGDVALGGKTSEEARRVTEGRVPEAQEKIELSTPQKDFALFAEELGVRLDVKATVERAYAVGRQGSVPERLAERVRALADVSVPDEVDYLLTR
jgi:hypothetical protein